MRKNTKAHQYNPTNSSYVIPVKFRPFLYHIDPVMVRDLEREYPLAPPDEFRNKDKIEIGREEAIDFHSRLVDGSQR